MSAGRLADFLPGVTPPKSYATWKVWRGSVLARDIKTHPIPFAKRFADYMLAFDFAQQTGAIGAAALNIYSVLLFKFHGREGQIYPSLATLARVAGGLSVATVKRHLQDLERAGLVSWFRRSKLVPGPQGGWILEQISNLYSVPPSSQWKGYRPPPKPPAPEAEDLGQTRPMGFKDAQATGSRAGDAWLEQSPDTLDRQLGSLAAQRRKNQQNE